MPARPDCQLVGARQCGRLEYCQPAGRRPRRQQYRLDSVLHCVGKCASRRPQHCGWACRQQSSNGHGLFSHGGRPRRRAQPGRRARRRELWHNHGPCRPEPDPALRGRPSVRQRRGERGANGTAGGLAAVNSGTITNAFATGNVTGAAGVGGITTLGGLVGSNQGED